MTPLQEATFQLLCEIDDICRENHITYYLHAGSVIGAVRHHSFVPWDDDIDIAVTRSSWEKLKPLLENTSIPNRALVLPEKYDDYHFTYPQYKNTATSIFYRSGAFQDFPLGAFIDILIMDPVRDNEKTIKKHMDNLKLLAELRCSKYILNRTSDWKRYNRVKFLEKYIGRKRILSYLSKKLELGTEEDCCGYVQRVGVYMVFCDKKYLAEPDYVEIEGRMFPAPTHVEEYLRYTYGDSWMRYPENRANHGFLSDMDYPFTTFQKDFQPYINKERYLKGWERYKFWRIQAIPEEDQVRICNTRRIAELKALAANTHLAGVNLREMLDGYRFNELEEHLKDYLQTQFSPRFRQDGIPIPVNSDIFYTAAMFLVFRGYYDIADKLLQYNLTLGRPNGDLEKIREAIECSRKLSVAIYDHRWDWEEILSLTEEGLDRYPHHVDFSAAKCALLLRGGSSKGCAREAARICVRELSYHPASDILLKNLADAKMILGKRCKALKLYQKVYSETNNGMLRLELESKWSVKILNRRLEPICPKKVSVSPSSEEVIQERLEVLLEELDEICQEENIPYFLGGYLAAQAVDLKTFAPGCWSHNIIMHPKDRTRFRQVMERRLLENRALESFENNPSYPDFSMRYCDTDTVLFDLRAEGFYRFHAVNITVYFVRPEPKHSLLRKFNNGLYAVVEALAFPSIFDNRTRKKIVAGCLGRMMTTVFGKKTSKRLLWGWLYHSVSSNPVIHGTIKDYWNKRIYLPEVDFSQKDICQLNCHFFPVPVNYDFYIRPQISGRWYTYAGMQFKLTLPFLVEFDLPSEVFKKRLDFLRLKKKHSHALKRLERYNKNCTQESSYTVYAWNIMLRSMDRLRMYKQYAPIKGRVLAYHRSGNYQTLSKMLASYITAITQNAKRAKALVFDPDIFWITCSVLQRQGNTALVAKILPWVPAAHLRFINLSCGSVSDMRKAEIGEEEKILRYLSGNIVNCLYMYADIFKYGLESGNLTVWFDTDNLGIRMVVMKYHRNFQVYANRGFSDVDALIALIQEEKPIGISARKEIAIELSSRLQENYQTEYGAVFRGKPIPKDDLKAALQDCTVEIEEASEADAEEIAKLLFMDEDLGVLYTEESLAEELRERIRTGMGRSYIIRNKGKIVAHNATYAECDKFVVVGGLMIHPEYRNTEYAHWVDLKCSLEFQKEGKSRYFFVTNEKVIKLFKRLKTPLVAGYGKLARLDRNGTAEN